MSTDSATKIECLRCGTRLDPADNFCRHCGDATQSSSTGISPGLRRTANKPRFSETRLGILFILFVGLGPLGLPFLFRSKVYSRSEKIGLTVLLIMVTVLLVYLLWYTVTMFLDALAESGLV